MATTPEGKVKKMVNAVLDEFCERTRECGTVAGLCYHVDNLYRFWPVPSGFGQSSLDCLVTYYGCSIFIETKAPGKKPTDRQELTIAQTKAAKGLVFVIDGPEGCVQLRSALDLIRLSHANNSQ